MSKAIKTEKELEEKLRTEKRMMILFYAPWCPFCQRFLPEFEKYSKNYPEICFKASTDDLEECEDEYSIEAIPTVLYFENGKVTKRLDAVHGVGLDEKQLVKLLAECGLK